MVKVTGDSLDTIGMALSPEEVTKLHNIRCELFYAQRELEKVLHPDLMEDLSDPINRLKELMKPYYVYEDNLELLLKDLWTAEQCDYSKVALPLPYYPASKVEPFKHYVKVALVMRDLFEQIHVYILPVNGDNITWRMLASGFNRLLTVIYPHRALKFFYGGLRRLPHSEVEDLILFDGDCTYFEIKAER